MSPRASGLGGLALGLALGVGLAWLWQRNVPVKTNPKNGLASLVGNTPVVKIESLSRLTGCPVYAKVEMNNPGGSAKDRVALRILQNARDSPESLKPGDWVVEGTSGSTGISLAMLCRAMGFEAHIVVPDDTSAEKVSLLEVLGATVHKVRPASIVDKDMYVNYARQLCETVNADPSPRRAVYANQFETEANWTCHYDTTGPEILAQVPDVAVFVTGAGTGGTIAGVSRYLKEKNPAIVSVLADPQGSGLYNKIKHGVMYNLVEREGTRRRHQVDTAVEGIGLNRVTANLAAGLDYIDDAVRVSDTEALAMARYLAQYDGMFVGSSTAVNCAAVLKYAKTLPEPRTIVTVWCDSGARHMSKFWRLAKDVEAVV